MGTPPIPIEHSDPKVSNLGEADFVLFVCRKIVIRHNVFRHRVTARVAVQKRKSLLHGEVRGKDFLSPRVSRYSKSTFADQHLRSVSSLCFRRSARCTLPSRIIKLAVTWDYDATWGRHLKIQSLYYRTGESVKKNRLRVAGSRWQTSGPWAINWLVRPMWVCAMLLNGHLIDALIIHV